MGQAVELPAAETSPCLKQVSIPILRRQIQPADRPASQPATVGEQPFFTSKQSAWVFSWKSRYPRSAQEQVEMSAREVSTVRWGGTCPSHATRSNAGHTAMHTDKKPKHGSRAAAQWASNTNTTRQGQGRAPDSQMPTKMMAIAWLRWNSVSSAGERTNERHQKEWFMHCTLNGMHVFPGSRRLQSGAAITAWYGNSHATHEMRSYSLVIIAGP